MYNGLVQVFAVPSLCLYFEGKDASYLEYHPLFHLTRFHCLSRIPHLLPSSPCHGRFNKQKYTYLCLTCLTGDFLVYCEVHHRQSKTRRKRQIPCRSPATRVTITAEHTQTPALPLHTRPRKDGGPDVDIHSHFPPTIVAQNGTAGKVEFHV